MKVFMKMMIFMIHHDYLSFVILLISYFISIYLFYLSNLLSLWDYVIYLVNKLQIDIALNRPHNDSLVPEISVRPQEILI